MLNYTEKTQNTYVRSLTVWEIMAIENCGLPSGPRSIAVSWDLSGGRANDARVKCILLHFLQGHTVAAVGS
jgi:hypothetical protein